MAGLPVMSWLGIGTVIYLVYSTYLAIVSGSLPLDPGTDVTDLTIYTVGVAVYVAGYVSDKEAGNPDRPDIQGDSS